jgi:hypothetical protein
MSRMNSLLQLPMQPIISSPTLAVAGATVHGAVLSIVLAYWRSGCRALPADEAGLAAISRCYGAQWSRVRQPVMQALAEIIPHLASIHDRQMRARQARQEIARLGGIASGQKRRGVKQSVGGKNLLAQSPPAMLPPPQRATPYRNPRADLPALAQVAQGNARTQCADAGALLTTHMLRERRR